MGSRGRPTNDRSCLPLRSCRYTEQDWVRSSGESRSTAALPERIEAAPWGSFGPSVNRARRRLIFGQDHTDIDIFRFGGASPSKPVVASSLVDYAPSFSPDGGRIAFESSRSGFAREIWLANPDGTNAVQITRSTPDNPTPLTETAIRTGVLTAAASSSRLTAEPQIDLFTVDPDGNGRRQLTNDPFTDAVPTWSHDGRWIYYRQDRPEGRNICPHPEGRRLAAALDERRQHSTLSSPGTERGSCSRRPSRRRPCTACPLPAAMSSA